ncbi:sigma-54 dependent transcriptional regulator [Thermodesulfobacteriota bacterium]
MSKQKRILVVDDEITNLKLAEGILQTLGAECEFAYNGIEALGKLSPRVDLVLLDVMMPKMEGFETLRRIREHPSCADVPVIMVTVLHSKEDKLRAVEAGANDFISKPIDPLELRVRATSLLKMKEAQDEIKRHKAKLQETVTKRTGALTESERRFRALFESAQDFIFMKDGDLEFTDVNAVFLEFLGLTHTQVIGETDAKLFDDRYTTQSKDVESRVLAGQTIEAEQLVTHMQRSIRLNIVRFPMRDASGEVIGLCGIGREVSELGQVPFLPTRDHKYSSAAMQSALDAAHLAGETDSTVLLTGESGSGKDYMAHLIHRLSKRSGGPFRTVDCGAIPSELAESELFGHEAGAFTGAIRRKRGLVEMAEGGTLLLNEIGELPAMLQAKLLTFLDTLSFTRVGGEKRISVNVRLVAATNRELRQEVAGGRFRADLYYRLNVFAIRIPPLRDRVEDMPALLQEILHKLAGNMKSVKVPDVESAVLERLCRYDWPGNVRELRNVLERAMILSRGSSLRTKHILLGDADEASTSISAGARPDRTLQEALEETERSMIEDALRQSNGNKQQAANILGVSRFIVTRHMKKLGIDVQ